MALLDGNINQLDVKQKTIEEIREQNNDFTQNIIDCANDYTKAFSQETTKVIKELQPHQKEFFNLQPMPDKTKMKKVLSQDGTTYIWQHQASPQ